MELLNQFLPILALAVLTERIVELVFDILDTYTSVDFGQSKRIWTFVLALIIGVAVAFILNLTFFEQIGAAVGSETSDKLFTGLIAGAAAPYSHQLVELLFKVQQAVGRYGQQSDQSSEAS